ncbi:protein of unknown function [Modestobacter italicus]|uniref:Uncharacterized protein n=1 Tax=Modestobacter italicus (strain DSM 44449 / CECT 9708 / BC 501) TaxID=2732864 RepID=I4EX92_MODI5|nr:protein of unknown function [Modestobacter marinus]
MVLGVVLLLAAPIVLAWTLPRLGVHRPAVSHPDAPAGLPERFALTEAELVEVARAVAHGRTLADRRLRAAAVDWAEQVAGDPEPLRSRAVTWALVAGLAVLGVIALARGRWVVVGIGWTVEWQLAALWLAGGPRRALVRNGGPPAP